MSVSPSALRLPEFIDRRRIGRFQLGTVVLCGLVMFLDGFDTQAINYMAPAIQADWDVSKGEFAPIFSAALAGLMIGYLLLSPLSAKFGHKRMIVGGVLVFAVITLLSMAAQNEGQLLALRFVTGLGLGAATPSTIALTTEYSPKKVRASLVLAIYCAFGLGFIAANYVSGWLIPLLGWRAVFVAGGVLPLVLSVVLMFRLPESLAFLVRREKDAVAYTLLRKIDVTLPADAGARVTTEDEGGDRRVRLTDLVSGGNLLGTVVLWLIFILNLAMFYGLMSYLPTILSDNGYSGSTLATAASMIDIGGIAIVFLIGPAMDRISPFGSLGALYFAGAAFFILMSLVLGAPVWLVLVSIFLIGCAVSGGQKGAIALAAVFYPVELRSTGLGWALGVGRVGGIVGPLIVGGVLQAGWSPQQLFLAYTIPFAVCGAAVVYLGYRTKRARAASRSTRAGAETESLV